MFLSTHSLLSLRAWHPPRRSMGNFEGILLAIDNIEMIDSARVVELLNQYRDTLFAVPAIYWF